MPTDVRKIALAFEAVKLSSKQDKSGYVLVLSIHPNDVPEELMRSWVGTRYQCALVELGDDDQPVVPKSIADGERAVGQAGMLCRNPKFWKFMVEGGYALEEKELSCVEGLKETLGISSRSELRINGRARKLFEGLVTMFEQSLTRSGRSQSDD